MKTVELQDSQLVGYRDRAVGIYADASKSLKDVGDVLQQFTKLEVNEEGEKMIGTSLKKLEVAMQNIQKAHQEELTMTKEFNEYCGAEKK